MTILRIPTPLRAYTGGNSEVNVSGSNISEALTDLTSQYPTIKPHLFNDGGELRPFVNLFVGEHNIKDLQGVNTPIKDGDKVMLIPSIAGGSSSFPYGDDVRGRCFSVRSNLQFRDCFVAKCKCAPRNDMVGGG